MKYRIPVIVYRKLFIYLSLAFAGFAIVGCLTHELGHYAVARYLGFPHPRINYAYTFYDAEDSKDNIDLLAMWHRNQYAIEHNQHFAEEATYKHLMSAFANKEVMATIGGPLETMLTGTIGFLLLLFYRKTYEYKECLKVWQWLLIFLSLFWMREVFNLATGTVILLTQHRFGHGDETELSQYFGWYPETIYFFASAIALVILCIVLFFFIPMKQRFSFLLAGVVGGFGGSALWLCLLGPVIMP